MPWKKILIGLGAMAAIVVLVAFGFLFWLVHDLPSAKKLAAYEPPITTRVHAGDGTLIGEFAEENRIFVPYSDIPEHVVNAFLSAEDRHFFEHGGIDVVALIRSQITNIPRALRGRRLHGASTITQQVAGNMLLNRDYSVVRKVKEAVMAMRVEKAFSKEKILELYLNQIELGDQSFGVAAAALNYFNKPLSELTLSEAAMLAGLPKGPTKWNPKRNPELARQRRDLILDQMAENKKLYLVGPNGEHIPVDLAKAKAEPIRTVDRFAGEEFAAVQYFTEEVRRLITQKPDNYLPRDLLSEIKEQGKIRNAAGKRRTPEEALGEWFRTEGLSIRSTLDTRLQLIARRALRAGLEDYDRRHGYRGPIGRIVENDTWQQALKGVRAPQDLDQWREAVVLAADKTKATIGLADGAKGQLRAQDVDWAAKTYKRLNDPKARGLAQGDVILVEAVSQKGQYALRQVPQANGALVALDPHTGRVLAMVGGYSFQQSSFNRATQAHRQPGSTFKPFVYAAALNHGFTPASLILDAPFVDCQPGAPCYNPQNYTKDFYGFATMRLGLEQSRNAMTVRLAQEIGLEPVRDLARDLGVAQELPLFLSTALGSIETTPLAITAAYASFVNGGKKVDPTFIDRIQDRHGHTIYRRDRRDCAQCQGEWRDGERAPALADDRRQVLDPITAYQVSYMLEGVVQRGTGRIIAALNRPLAGKTGTTDDYRSAWFVGFSPDLVVGVYIGLDSNASLGDKETGGRAAAPIFKDFMGTALANEPPRAFRTPPGVKFVTIDARTGQLPGAETRETILEAFRPGTEPTASGTVSGIWNYGVGGGDDEQPSSVLPANPGPANGAPGVPGPANGAPPKPPQKPADLSGVF